MLHVTMPLNDINAVRSETLDMNGEGLIQKRVDPKSQATVQQPPSIPYRLRQNKSNNINNMSSTEAKKRRGKKEATTGPSTAAPPPLEDQLQRARAAVEHSERQMALLHKQWRTYLLRLSYLLILISMHQMQGPTGACLKDIKGYNAAVGEDAPISGGRAFVLVVGDSFSYVCAVAISACLSFFLLLEQPGTFSDPRYVLANALLPAMIGFHFYQKDQASCLNDTQLASIETVEPRTRSLPVVAVFHVIVTICYWFIDYQQQQQTRNIRMVENLQRDLDQARKKGETKKKS